MAEGNERPFALGRAAVGAAEKFLREFAVSLRQARESSAYALFFLRLLHRTPSERVNRAIDGYRRFALERVAKVLRVDFPSLSRTAPLFEAMDPRWNQREENPLEREQDVDPWLASVREQAEELGWSEDGSWQLVGMKLVLDVLEAARVLRAWADIGPVESAEPPEGHADDLRERLVDFVLRKSQTVRWGWQNLIDDVLSFLHKHLGFIFAVVLVALVLWKVEAVHSLILNLGSWSLAIVVVLALPPALLELLIVRIRRRSGGRLVYTWDVGGPSHRGLRAQSLEPGTGILRYPVPATPPLAFDDDLGPLQRQTSRPLADFAKRLLDPDSIVDVLVRARLLLIGYFVLGWLAGFGVLWAIAKMGWVTSSTFTVYLILSILYAVLIVGRLIDFWEFFDARPIRFRLLLLALFSLVALMLGWGHNFFIGAFFVAALWLFAAHRRAPWRGTRLALAAGCLLAAVPLLIQKTTREAGVWKADPAAAESGWRVDEAVWPFPGQDPVVVVASSGGGSRAAVYTGLTLRNLSRTTGCELEPSVGACAECPQIGDRIHAISSVSGGSLANAAYTVRRLAPKLDDTELIEALADDFLLPTLKGALIPRRSRGDAIEKHWQGLDELVRWRVERGPKPVRGDRPGVALGSFSLGDLASIWTAAVEAGRQPSAAPPPPFPMPLFNTSTLDGHDVVLSPLPVDLYTRRDNRRLALSVERNPYQKEGTTWVYYRDAIYGLEDLLGEHFDPLLSSAVRASANFPFGFPLVEIQTDRRLFLNPVLAAIEGSETTVHLTDGGALSNSGMWSLYHLLMNKSPALSTRGVLLIVVDASKMPTLGMAERTLQGLRAVIGDQAPIGQYLHRTMLDMLETKYGPHLAVAQIDLTPRVDRNVLTTWALDGGTLELLEQIFAEQWCAEQESLLEKWHYLNTGFEARAMTTGRPRLIDRARPPLD